MIRLMSGNPSHQKTYAFHSGRNSVFATIVIEGALFVTGAACAPRVPERGIAPAA
jgi:hypothetical protein